MRIRGLVTAGVMLVFLSASSPLATAAGNEPQQGEERKGVHPETGRLSFLGGDPQRPLKMPAAVAGGVGAEERARAALEEYAPSFGVSQPRRDLKILAAMNAGNGRKSVRFRQTYQGVPILGGELVVNLDAQGGLLSINGEAAPDVRIPTAPKVKAEAARASAGRFVAHAYGVEENALAVSDPELWIYDSRLLGPAGRPPELVWRVEVDGTPAAPVRVLVLVNAQWGSISLHFNQVDTAWDAGDRARPAGNGPSEAVQPKPAAQTGVAILTYTANHTSSLPGSLLCDESEPLCTDGDDAHADAAHRYALDTYEFYWNHHERNSIDNAGMPIISTVRYLSGYSNAFWNGEQMVYGDGAGFPLADDVVAHELTHGVTDYESGLFYYYQSGAINESLSDLWGEFLDLSNGAGNDAAGVRWEIGEDIEGYGTIRDMADPTAFGDPDRMTSPNYWLNSLDSGGVHSNSGVNNKAVYLMTDGDTFNGYTISGIGTDKVAAIYYEAQANFLTSGSDYLDLYQVLYQACLNLALGPEGVTYPDCLQVRNATLAVEMNLEPTTGFNPEAPLCSDSTEPVDLFFEDFESGVDGWASGAYTGLDTWYLDTGYSTSGLYQLGGYLYDYSGPSPVENPLADFFATMAADVALPVGSQPYVRFRHAFGFSEPDYDGGWVEYSVDGGNNWAAAAALPTAGMDSNGNINTEYGDGDNPHTGKEAFVGDSHGYVSTRYDLASLAGSSVRFRFRISTDSYPWGYGWSLDDVRLYTCTSTPTFVDVPVTHWAHDYIEALYDAGYIAGCSADPRMYCPDSNLSRAESAVFVERGVWGEGYTPLDPTGQIFGDVPVESWAARWVNALYADGFTAGCSASPLMYCPWQVHTRAEGSVFFLRMFMGDPGYNPSDPIGLFADVPLEYWGARWVEGAYLAGLIPPCDEGPPMRFCPEDPLSRAMAAFMMVRAKKLPVP